MTLIIKLLTNNNNFDNDLIFYSLLIGAVGAIGYSLTTKILLKSYVEKSIQTDAGEIYSDKSSQISPDDFPSIHTLSPSSSTETIRPPISKVETKSITGDITPVNIDVRPNQDIVGRVVDPSNAEYIATKVEQLNALDPFAATPWTPERVVSLIDTIGTVNNLFN
jgi:hypothetical protein